MAKMERATDLQRKLRAMGKYAKIEATGSYAVGYSASYAVIVHEDMEAAHGEDYNEKYAAEIAAGTKHSRGPNQQAKYLETPFRRLSKQFGRIVEDTYKSTKSVMKGLLKCALLLLRESKKIVPVDTGVLKASAEVWKDSK